MGIAFGTFARSPYSRYGCGVECIAASIFHNRNYAMSEINEINDLAVPLTVAFSTYYP